jgi:hypothetical protein
VTQAQIDQLLVECVGAGRYLEARRFQMCRFVSSSLASRWQGNPMQQAILVKRQRRLVICPQNDTPEVATCVRGRQNDGLRQLFGLSKEYCFYERSFERGALELKIGPGALIRMGMRT